MRRLGFEPAQALPPTTLCQSSSINFPMSDHTNLIDLPDDVLYTIISQLEEPDTSDPPLKLALQSFALANKRLHNLCQPYLFRDLLFLFSPPHIQHGRERIRGLIEYPRLLEHVHTLKIRNQHLYLAESVEILYEMIALVPRVSALRLVFPDLQEEKRIMVYFDLLERSKDVKVQLSFDPNDNTPLRWTPIPRNFSITSLLIIDPPGNDYIAPFMWSSRLIKELDIREIPDLDAFDYLFGLEWPNLEKCTLIWCGDLYPDADLVQDFLHLPTLHNLSWFEIGWGLKEKETRLVLSPNAVPKLAHISPITLTVAVSIAPNRRLSRLELWIWEEDLLEITLEDGLSTLSQSLLPIRSLDSRLMDANRLLPLLQNLNRVGDQLDKVICVIRRNMPPIPVNGVHEMWEIFQAMLSSYPGKKLGSLTLVFPLLVTSDLHSIDVMLGVVSKPWEDWLPRGILSPLLTQIEIVDYGGSNASNDIETLLEMTLDVVSSRWDVIRGGPKLDRLPGDRTALIKITAS